MNGTLTASFSPNRVLSKGSIRAIVLVELLAMLSLWYVATPPIIPKPFDILRALSHLWSSDGLFPELFTSFILNLEALAIATVISLGLAYMMVVPALRPLVAAVSKLRFLSMVGLSFLFTITFGSGHGLKLSLLVFGVTVFFVTSMADVVAQTPKEQYDLGRTLRMGDWRVVWEVVVLGRADAAFDVLRQNAAMGWMMLSMVEGISRSEGGIGTLLLNSNRYFNLDAVFAIQIVILLLGLFQDWFIGFLKQLCCPYAEMSLEGR